MKTFPRALALVLVLGLGSRATAHAFVAEGQPAPAYTKQQLDTPAFGQTTPRSLSTDAGKVIFLFMMGYNCPVCLADGPSVQQNIHRYYQDNYPGQVQVVGADAFNGTQAQLRQFKTSTGATYPLLLNAESTTGTNMNMAYGPNDVHVVISKQGIVRLNTIKYAHGQRYKLAEIRACIDSLITRTAGVGDPSARGFALSASPNPFRGDATIVLANPGPSGTRAEVVVHDVSGRAVAMLLDGHVASGSTTLEWNGRSSAGQVMPAGVYLVRARVGEIALQRRIVRLP